MSDLRKQLDPVFTECPSSTTALPSVGSLYLYGLDLRICTLRILLQSFVDPLPTLLAVQYCQVSDWDRMLDDITELAPGLQRLYLSTFPDEVRLPRRPDFLKNLQALVRLRVSGVCLDWDSLQYLGPEVNHLGLYGARISAAHLATNLAIRTAASGIKVDIRLETYSDRERSVLEVRNLLSTHVRQLNACARNSR